jgi:hypothetical protein
MIHEKTSTMVIPWWLTIDWLVTTITTNIKWFYNYISTIMISPYLLMLESYIFWWLNHIKPMYKNTISLLLPNDQWIWWS